MALCNKFCIKIVSYHFLFYDASFSVIFSSMSQRKNIVSKNINNLTFLNISAFVFRIFFENFHENMVLFIIDSFRHEFSNRTFEAIASYSGICTTFIAYFHERSKIQKRSKRKFIAYSKRCNFYINFQFKDKCCCSVFYIF